MARGFIFNISKYPEDLEMDESDFYETFDAMQVDYVRNCDREEAQEEKERFVKALRDRGAETGSNENGTYVVFTEQTKENCFKDRLNTLKNVVQNMTLDEFSRDTQKIWQIRMLINNTYEDAVFDSYDFFTIDEWIRKLTAGEKYYVGNNVVFMH